MALETYKDFTVKVRVTYPEEVERKLMALKAEFMGEYEQTDHYFSATKGKLKWRKGNIENVIMHYERVSEGGVERTVVYRYDVNPTESDIDALKQHHQALGAVKKKRRIFYLSHVKIHLDEFCGEHFLEIEAIDEHNVFSYDQLKVHCRAIQQQLGFSDQDVIPTGYLK